MSWFVWVWIIFVWSVVGGFILKVADSAQTGGAINMAEDWEFVNPIHVHKYNHVNWFGAIIVALVYNALCPIGSVCYWLYKLCTIGRE